MTSPFTGGSATMRSKAETFTFRGESYTVTRYYFQCDQTGRTFTNASVDDKVMEDLYAQYRKRHGIPSPARLKSLREKYGLSAHTMSRIAGIGVNQYGLYENGEMPSLVVGHRLASLFDRDGVLKAIDSAQEKLGKDYTKVRAKVEAFVEPQVFNIRRDYYPQFDEIVPLVFPSMALSIRKSRWSTCQI